MKRRQSISNFNKWSIVSIGTFFLLLSLLFGILAIVPIIGIIGTFAGVLASTLWIFILGTWLLLNAGSAPRLVMRAVVSFGLEGLSFLSAILPFLGGLIDFMLSLLSLVLLYAFIDAVQKEDREYNEKNGLT
ncbi:MAG: hypothetical protein AAB573_05345 [Patescibacteria group bacterium]